MKKSRFTKVMAKHIFGVFMHHSVNPIFGRSLASSRIIRKIVKFSIVFNTLALVKLTVYAKLIFHS